MIRIIDCQWHILVHTTPEEFENRGFNLKTHQTNAFRTCYAGGIWKQRFHSGNSSDKCFPSTLRRRNLKTEVTIWTLIRQMLSVHATPEEFENRGFTLETHQTNAFRPHYAGRIIKRNNHRPFWICVWGRLGQGNHVIIVTPSFSKSSVFKMFSVHTNAKRRRFQIPPVWRAFSKSSLSVED